MERKNNTKKLGIEKLKGGKWAVVDLSSPYTTFTKVLTPEETKIFKATKTLPAGVKQVTSFPQLAVTSSHEKAVAIKDGKKSTYFTSHFGIFKSYGQIQKVTQLVTNS